MKHRCVFFSPVRYLGGGNLIFFTVNSIVHQLMFVMIPRSQKMRENLFLEFRSAFDHILNWKLVENVLCCLWEPHDSGVMGTVVSWVLWHCVFSKAVCGYM